MNETTNEKPTRQVEHNHPELEQAQRDATGWRPWTKRPVPLLLGMLLLWIAVGAYLVYLFCCFPKTRAMQAAVWTVTDIDEQQKVANGNENVTFAYGTSTPIVAEKTAAAYGKIATYLTENEDKILKVQAAYSESEQNPTDYDNLGLARAADLKAALIKLGVPSERIVTSTKKTTDPIHWEDTVYGAANLEVKTLEGRYLTLYEEGGLNTDATDNLRFAKNSATYDKPVSTSIRAALGSLADYLKQHPDKKLQLTGWVDTAEKDADADAKDKLGKTRAENIKKLLTSLGAPAKQIKVTAQERDDLVFIDNQLYGGTSYGFLDDKGNVVAAVKPKVPQNDDNALAKEESTDDKNSTKENQTDDTANKAETDDKKEVDKNTTSAKETNDNANKNNRDNDKTTTETATKKATKPNKSKIPAKAMVYFGTNQAASQIDAATKAVLEKILEHAKSNDESTVVIDGYTDSAGSIAYNSELSKRRAAFAKNYLVQNGLAANRVKLRFLGSENAIGDNTSVQGRAKNRRVEVYVER